MSVFSAKVSIDDTRTVVGVTTTLPEVSYFSATFRGTSLLGNWEPPELTLADEGVEILTDFMCGLSSAAFFLSQQAADYFANLPQKGFELLETRFNNRKESFLVLNVTTVADCLDKKVTRITYSSTDPQRVLLIQQPRFIEERIPEVLAFKVPEDTSRIFVTDAFVELVIAKKLTGIYFEDPSTEEVFLKKALFGTPFLPIFAKQRKKLFDG